MHFISLTLKLKTTNNVAILNGVALPVNTVKSIAVAEDMWCTATFGAQKIRYARPRNAVMYHVPDAFRKTYESLISVGRPKTMRANCKLNRSLELNGNMVL